MEENTQLATGIELGELATAQPATGIELGEAATAQPAADVAASNAPGAVFSRALCAIDGKDGGFEAVRRAASLVGPGGRLTLLIVTSFRKEGDLRGPAITSLDAHRVTSRADAIAHEAGVPAIVVVEPEAPPARMVLQWAAEHDLLALGAPSGSWLGGLLVSGVGDAALGDVRRPLLTAREGHAADPFKHLLIASDGREDSGAALSVAGQIARVHGSRVTILHAYGHSHVRRDHLVAQCEALEGSCVQAPDLLLRRGHAHEVIVEAAARLGASLIVLGSRRRAGPSALGSVSRRVVHEAGCSVLTVPPEPIAES